MGEISGQGQASVSDSKSSSKSSSLSQTLESGISKKQFEILDYAFNEYQNYFEPELKNAIEETKQGSAAFNATMQSQADAINASYANGKKTLMQNLTKQGIAEPGSGVANSLLAQNENSRRSNLATAYYNTLQQNQKNKQNLLQLGLSKSPTPTSDVAYHQTSESESESFSKSHSVSGGGGGGLKIG